MGTDFQVEESGCFTGVFLISTRAGRPDDLYRITFQRCDRNQGMQQCCKIYFKTFRIICRSCTVSNPSGKQEINQNLTKKFKLPIDRKIKKKIAAPTFSG